MIEIHTLNSVEEAAQLLLERTSGSGLVRIEGFCGAGKTRLAAELAKLSGGFLVATDSFAQKFDDPPAYSYCVQVDKLADELDRAIASSRFVILEGVCLDEVAPHTRWQGKTVYVKRLSFNGGNRPIWSDGLSMEDQEPEELPEPHRSVLAYHLAERPHQRAELIVELPVEGDLVTEGPLERDLCLDPPGAVTGS